MIGQTTGSDTNLVSAILASYFAANNAINYSSVKLPKDFGKENKTSPEDMRGALYYAQKYATLGLQKGEE